MAERRKANQSANRSANSYFWRTYDQKEIDLIEERGGKLFGYEFKWKDQMIKNSGQNEFLSGYPEAELAVISQENFVEFLK